MSHITVFEIAGIVASVFGTTRSDLELNDDACAIFAYVSDRHTPAVAWRIAPHIGLNPNAGRAAVVRLINAAEWRKDNDPQFSEQLERVELEIDRVHELRTDPQRMQETAAIYELPRARSRLRTPTRAEVCGYSIEWYRDNDRQFRRAFELSAE